MTNPEPPLPPVLAPVALPHAPEPPAPVFADALAPLLLEEVAIGLPPKVLGAP